MGRRLQNSNEYLFSIVTKVFVVLISLIQQVLLARFLGAGIKGEVSYIQNLVGIISILIVVGLHHSYPVFRRKDSFSIENRNIFLSGVLILFLSYVFVSYGFFAMSTIDKGIRLAFLISIFVGYGNIVGYVYLIENPNRRNADILIFSVIDVVVYAMVCFFCIPTVYIGLILLYCIEIAKCFYFTFKLHLKIAVGKNTFKVLKEQLTIGFFPMLSLLLTSLNYKLDVIMLSNAKNITAADVGVYSVAIAIAEKALLLPDALKEILISKLSKGSSYKEVVKINRIAIMMTLCTAFCISIFCTPVVNILFGEEFKDAVGLIRVTTFGTVFMVIFKMVASYNITRNKQVTNLLFLMVSVTINCICNALLIPKYGTYGAAYATIGCFFVCGLLFTLYFCKTEHVKIQKFLFVEKNDFSKIRNIFVRG